MIKNDVKKLILAVACILNGRTVSHDEMGDTAFSLGLRCGIGGIISIEDRMKNIRKNMLFETERSELYSYLESIGCWYMPMKGLVIDSYYPATGMRQMSDNDIFFDINYRDAVREWFVERGYSTDRFNGMHVHDVYRKNPVYNFEMHTVLFGERNVDFASYFDKIENRLIEVGCERKMTDEDFYMYMLCHSYKHYSNKGDGLRLLTDVYVYLKVKKASLDWEYIDNGLAATGLLTFENRVRSLSEKCFNYHKLEDSLGLTEDEESMLLYIIGSGARGKIENSVEHALTEKTKGQYLRKRLWPPREFFVKGYPVCRDHPWIVPFYRVYRMGRAVGDYKRLRREVIAVKENKR